MSADKKLRILPLTLSSFHGRQKEINDICDLLTQSHNRLVTLIGVGGIGKTRLAIEVANRLFSDFNNGVCFVSLQGVHSTDHLVSAIIEAVGPLALGTEKPEDVLIRYLQSQDLLLVLDNFEQLTDELSFIIKLLENAPQIKLLITSRVGLNIQGEHGYFVRGLYFPVKSDIVNLKNYQRYEFVALFIQRGNQARNGFATEDTMPDIARICAVVEGHPLALELTASWLRGLICKRILEKIEQGLDAFESPFMNTIDRHKTLSFVFEEIWNSMSSEEQEVFMRTAVFRGGFTSEAIQFVSGAKDIVLTQLANRALVRLNEGNKRYEIHELLRQFAESKLSIDDKLYKRTLLRHSQYYMAFVASKEEDVQINAVAAHEDFQADIHNIRLGWRTAAMNRLNDDLLSMFRSFTMFMTMQGYVYEYQQEVAFAISYIEQYRSREKSDVVLFFLSYMLAVCLMWFRNTKEAIKLIQKSEKLGSQINNLDVRYWFWFHIHASSVMASAGLNKKALAHLDSIFRLKPASYDVLTEWMAYAYRSFVLIQDKQFEQALVSANKAWDLVYQNAYGYPRVMMISVLSLARLHSKQREPVIDLLLEFIEHFRNGMGGNAFSMILYAIAIVFHNQELYEDSLEMMYISFHQPFQYLFLRANAMDFKNDLEQQLNDNQINAIQLRVTDWFGEHLAATMPGGLKPEFLDSVVKRLENIKGVQLVIRPPMLTEKESDVLLWLAHGMTNKQIAEKMVVSVNTIKRHIHNMMKKLDAKSRGEVVDIARRNGWLT